MTLQPQFTSFNPYQQQLEQQAAQAEYMRQQELFVLQQQQQAQQQQQQQEEWMRQQLLQQQMQQQQMMMQQQQQQQSLFTPTPQITVQPTGFGSNNPFAPASPSPSQFSPTQSQNNGSNAPSFNLSSTYENHNQANNLATASSPSLPTGTNPYTQKQINVKVNKNVGENEARLENLFANRDDGQDTFGNTGALRYGYTNAGKALIGQQTGAATSGHNPFALQQQQQQNNDKPFFDI